MARRTVVLSEHLGCLLDTLGITAEQLAQIVGANNQTMYGWLADNNTFPEGRSKAKLNELDELIERLNQLFDAPGPALWVHAPSGYLRGRAPLDMLLNGDIRRAELALDALEAGVFV